MHDRHCPLWDLTVFMDFRANVLLSGSSSLPSSVVLGHHRSCWKQPLLNRGWFKYSLTFARVCSSWKRAQHPKPPCSGTVKGTRAGEEGQTLKEATCPEVVLLRFEGERDQV